MLEVDGHIQSMLGWQAQGDVSRIASALMASEWHGLRLCCRGPARQPPPATHSRPLDIFSLLLRLITSFIAAALLAKNPRAC